MFDRTVFSVAKRAKKVQTSYIVWSVRQGCDVADERFEGNKVPLIPALTFAFEAH